jgi:phosphohistidine phosphatase
MLLYILRHADADTVAPSDDERFLSEKGVMQSQRIARFCDAHDFKPDVIFTSPLRRAHQTAKLVAEVLRSELRVVRWLMSGAQPSALLGELKDSPKLHSAMLVGHEPDLSQFVAHLVGAPKSEAIRIKKASLVHLVVNEFVPGGSRLEFLVPARLL